MELFSRFGVLTQGLRGGMFGLDANIRSYLLGKTQRKARIPRETTTVISELHEPIGVSAVFRDGRLRPVSFFWRNRRYRVTSVTGVYRSTQGGFKRYNYTVCAGTEDLYELSLSTEDMTWRIERVYSDG